MLYFNVFIVISNVSECVKEHLVSLQPISLNIFPKFMEHISKLLSLVTKMC